MKSLAIILLVFFSTFLSAQTLIPQNIEVTCAADHMARPSYIPAPDLLLRSKALSRFEFIYTDSVPEEAKIAIEYAGKIWSSFLESEIPIRVAIKWSTFEGSTFLGTGGPRGYFRLDTLVPKPGLLYPIALAESLFSRNFNGENEDIGVSINSSYDWYYGLDGNVRQRHHDLVTLVLHEIGHGLGFNSSDRITDEGMGKFSTPPRIFDAFLGIQNPFIGGTENYLYLTDTTIYNNPSFELFDQFVSERIVFADASVKHANSNQFVWIYSPSEYGRSSLSHLDNLQRDPRRLGDALMDPFLARQEAIHRPGPITLAILSAMGWRVDFHATVTSISDLPKKELMLFPNPVIDHLQISWPEALPMQVPYQITDISGRIVQTGQITQNQTLPLTNFKPGYYHLNLQDAEAIYYGKFVIGSR
ncbi:MAG: hypothetical protein Sapg2KO_38080 [Saprospiraceae bacterium]